MTSRRAHKSIALLALILNLGGGPVAWAHWLDAAGASQQEVMSAECHGHPAAQPADETSPGSLPCCQPGECHCAAPPAVAVIPVLVEWHSQVLTRASPRDTSSMPPTPLDDDLRPPIR